MLLFSMFIEITSFVGGRTGVRLHWIVPDDSSAKYTCTGRLKKNTASGKMLTGNFANSAFASTRTRSRWIRIFQHDTVSPLIGVCPSALIWTKSTHNDGSDTGQPERQSSSSLATKKLPTVSFYVKGTVFRPPLSILPLRNEKYKGLRSYSDGYNRDATENSSIEYLCRLSVTS